MAEAAEQSWYWRWGVPLVAGVGALAGVAVARSGDGGTQGPQVIVAAGALSLCLLACWRVARFEGEPITDGRSGARAEAVLTMVVIATGLALSAYFLDLPLRDDESRTFALLAPQSFSTVASTYRDPNNHVLHTLLVWATHQFGGWDRVVLRLPAFFSFCLLLPALWWFARREYGPTAAAFTTALAASTPYFVEFATNARGYTLLLLLFVTALLCGQSLVRRPERTTLWAVWAATIALGFFTVPLMVFPAATTAIWMALARWRRRGREGLASFAFKIAAWSVAALAFTGVLYAPILATQGIAGMQAALSGFGLPPVNLGRLLEQPVFVWHQWHWMTPAWAQGVLLALVFVGMAAPARTCRCRGTLLAAMVVTTAAVMLAKPVIFSPRMLVWALLVLTVLAGAGAAIVLKGLVVRAEARWLGRALPSGGLVATCGAVLVVLCASGRWAAQPGATRMYGQDGVWARRIPAMVSSVAGQTGDASAMPSQLQVGDYFTIHNLLAIPTFLHMRDFRHVDASAGWYYPLDRPRSRWSVHRVSAPGRPLGSKAQGRLFVFQGFFREERPASAEGMTVRQFLEAGEASHELVAAFDDGSVFIVDEWTKHP